MDCPDRGQTSCCKGVKRLWWSGGAGGIEDYRGDTFRAVYTLKYADVVFMLHAFRKRSKTGRETPRRDIELIKQRLREAGRIAKEMMT